ncbi:F0F1 ATP synthase subunit epsilon [Notoacmeibacter marinus]|uniref:F0F1 ATP synthase subunit epsilon n=1 Tax=Notoacmeibacter marinus TaxID=1876515 RepID=UPI000DF3C8A0|nr:F0F1 ATP synthase subunit epsilon [Notoacmeibacter marinus]
MSMAFTFELVSPERLLVSREVDSVVVPAAEGDMTAMPNHAPTMSALRAGMVTVETGGDKEQFVVLGGFADVQPDSCTILAETAATPGDFDRDLLTSRIDEAQTRLKETSDDDERSELEEVLGSLTTLNEQILPA